MTLNGHCAAATWSGLTISPDVPGTVNLGRDQLVERLFVVDSNAAQAAFRINESAAVREVCRTTVGQFCSYRAGSSKRVFHS